VRVEYALECACKDRGVAQLSNIFQATAPAFGPSSRHWKLSNRLGGPSQNCLLGQWEVRELRVGLSISEGAKPAGYSVELLGCLGGPPTECCLTARHPCMTNQDTLGRLRLW